ncbi:unnamed protein product [Tenebrio molitor]|nr:unnamed protein product [Tenebrio molitor]
MQILSSCCSTHSSKCFCITSGPIFSSALLVMSLFHQHKNLDCAISLDLFNDPENFNNKRTFSLLNRVKPLSSFHIWFSITIPFSSRGVSEVRSRLSTMERVQFKSMSSVVDSNNSTMAGQSVLGSNVIWVRPKITAIKG